MYNENYNFVFIKVYIVYMGALTKNTYSPLAHHRTILEQVLENSTIIAYYFYLVPSSLSDSLVHSYKRSFNGFAAKLIARERKKLDN
ncbi:hypothetical protein IFM89_012432 [Coptis chinensis]|uniref:Inhibitor I9 domain-containing protein n=1 Tax=Coptis chinensis TaxID=261450 RepID=A0A835M4R2_9MAGN|nr:hypothetical protein IFM89_012432 [Coptis chinensis]